MNLFKIALTLVLCLLPSPAWAYLGTLQSLGQVTQDAKNVVVLRVAKVNREKKVVIFTRVADLKGTHPTDEVKHELGGDDAREVEAILNWAEPGNVAIFFHTEKAGLMCIGNVWYECAAGEAPWWTMTRGLPEMSYSYVGPVSKLRRHIAAILDGKEVLVTALDPSEVVAYRYVATKDLPRARPNNIWRIKASLAIGGWPKGGVAGAGDANDVPSLLEGIRSDDAGVRAESARELAWIGAPAREAGAALTKALKDPDGLVRVAAALAVVQVDADTAGGLPVLIEALKDRDSKVRSAAALALGDIGPEAGAAVAALGRALEDEDLRVRWHCAQALGEIGAVAATDHLTKALKDKTIRSAAAGALGALGPRARSAGPVLAASLKDADESYRWTLIGALARIGGPDAKAAVPFMIEAINGKNDTDKKCYRALTLLEFMGPPGKDAAPAVIDGLKSSRFQPGWASTTLASIDIAAALPFLIAQLKGPDVVLRKYAAAYLGFAGPAAKDALPALKAAIADGGEAEVSRIAAWASEMVRGDFDKAVPLLLRGLKNDEPSGYNHRFCWEALDHFQPDARAAVGALSEALQDKSARVRRAAALALGKIGADAKDAIPHLEKLRRDDDAGVRASVAKALDRIKL
jgi:HEAT repeat protein